MGLRYPTCTKAAVRSLSTPMFLPFCATAECALDDSWPAPNLLPWLPCSNGLLTVQEVRDLTSCWTSRPRPVQKVRLQCSIPAQGLKHVDGDSRENTKIDARPGVRCHFPQLEVLVLRSLSFWASTPEVRSFTRVHFSAAPDLRRREGHVDSWAGALNPAANAYC